MTFSNQVKNEISKGKINSKLAALLELSAILKTNASISIRNAFVFNQEKFSKSLTEIKSNELSINISFTSENENVAKRIYKLINFLYDYEAGLSYVENNNIMKNGLYMVLVEDENLVNRMLEESGIDLYGNYIVSKEVLLSRMKSLKIKGDSDGKVAFLRGAFLGAGSVVDPKKNYHLEIVTGNFEDADLLREILSDFYIESLINERKSKYVVYIKNSEVISDFIAILGANKAMLELENTKAMKELRNNINRQVNCDTANINKTISTAGKQLEDIEMIENARIALPEGVKEIMEMRKKYPEYSLKQLGETFDPPISKSGVAHRMKKIADLARGLKGKRGKL